MKSLPLSAGKITSVNLKGSREKLKWKQTETGLEVTLPAKRPCKFAFGLKIKEMQ